MLGHRKGVYGWWKARDRAEVEEEKEESPLRKDGGHIPCYIVSVGREEEKNKINKKGLVVPYKPNHDISRRMALSVIHHGWITQKYLTPKSPYKQTNRTSPSNV